MTQAKGDGFALLIVSVVFLALCWVTFATRVWVRVWRKAFGADDWTMLIGIVSAVLYIILAFVRCEKRLI